MKVAAGALFVDSGKILLLKPSYLDYWLPPGGKVEPGESPRDGCAREVLEEVGIQLNPRRLLCVDFIPQGSQIGLTGKTRTTKEDELVFMFDAGQLSQDIADRIQLDGKEVIDSRWLTPEEAVPLIPNYLQQRLPRCLDAHQSEVTMYLELGQPVGP